MSARAIRQAVQAGIERGILPAGSTAPRQDARPWPVTLLTALGAWLAVLPLMGVVGLLLGDLVRQSAGPYLVAALLLAGSVVVLRSRDLAVFIEQLAVPALLVGLGALAYGLLRDLPDRIAAALLAAGLLALAGAIDRAWLRVLLGAAAAAFWVVALFPSLELLGRGSGSMFSFWLALHGALAVWLGAMELQRRTLLDGRRAALASVVESAGAGWAAAVLVSLAWWSGMTFLVGASLGGGFVGSVVRELSSSRRPGLDEVLMRACSAALGACAVVLAGRAWPSLRQPPAALVGVVLAALGWFLPALGAVLLALAGAATRQRWRIATLAAVAAAWIVGGFYYQLDWPLAHKALVLVAAGVALGALAWSARPDATASPAPAVPDGSARWAAGWMLAGVALTVLLANLSIWRKEALIAGGQKVFVALAPVDPRSLMQGDFMRLNYAVPGANDEEFRQRLSAQRPYVIARRDGRGVAQLLRTARGNAPLQTGEMRIELTPKDGRWILVSDAWFFREGDGQRFEKARYGEFRVAPDGQALLVGLADEQLQPIPVNP